MAYGARLESVLGESPQGFESPILRQSHESPTDPGPAGLSSHPGADARAPDPSPALPDATSRLYPGALPVSPIAPLPAGSAPA